MVPKLDMSALTKSFLKKSKGKQARSIEVVALRSSNPLVNAPPIVPSSTSKVQSKKRKRSSFPNGVDVAQPFTSSGRSRDGRLLHCSRRETMERPPLEVFDL